MSKKTAAEFLQELKDNPSRMPEVEEVMEFVLDEFPKTEPVPSAAEMDDALLTAGPIGKYRLGQWIERMGNDMVWHLEPIRRITRKVILNENDEEEFEIYYKTSDGELYLEDDVRCPREGLVRQFGMRPLVWQQWALFKIENYIRFQDEHERDFEYADFYVRAKLLWEEWLHDTRNEDFLILFQSKPEIAQQKLFDHIMQPFRFMRQVASDKERWDLTQETSCYQYNALLGSGYLTSLTVFFIQISVPFLILLYGVRESNRFPNFLNSQSVLNFQLGNVGGANNGLHGIQPTNESLATYDFAALFDTNWDYFCHQPVAWDQFVINIIIFLVYVTRVVPSVYDALYSAIGDKDSIRSKVNSIRNISWLQGDDYFWLQLGYKMDRYMNTFYVAMVNLAMLFILFLTTNTLDVVLNALAIEFVLSFDEEIPESVWYDADRRWFAAGIIEVFIRGELLLEPLFYADVFANMYDIDFDLYCEKIGGPFPLRDAKQADIDRENPKFCGPKDKLWKACAEVAKEMNSVEAIWQFAEQPIYFGFGDRLFKPRLGGVFNRYLDYYTWSRWDIVLFLSRVPKPGELSKFAGLASLVDPNGPKTGAYTLNSTGLISTGFMNFDENSCKSVNVRFFNSVSDLLKCKYVSQGVSTAYRRRNYHQIPFRFCDGIFEWCAITFVAIAFPICLAFYAFLVFECEDIV